MRREYVVTALLIAAALPFAGFGPQRGATPLPQVKPYPGSIQFCREHIVGAPQPDGTPGAHIEWTAYHSTDPQEKVAGHYVKTLGAEGHHKERADDVWRLPVDKPTRVLHVIPAPGELPSNKCKPAPASARTVILISTMTRPQ